MDENPQRMLNCVQEGSFLRVSTELDFPRASRNGVDLNRANERTVPKYHMIDHIPSS